MQGAENIPVIENEIDWNFSPLCSKISKRSDNSVCLRFEERHRDPHLLRGIYRVD